MNRELYRNNCHATVPLRDVEESLLPAAPATEILSGRIGLRAAYARPPDCVDCLTRLTSAYGRLTVYSVEASPMSNWSRIYESPSYKRMVAQKTRAVTAMMVFFIAYYFALPVLVAYWPDVMARQVWGYVNWAYLFAFSQFLMAWGVAYVYMRYASRFDSMAASILSEADGRPVPGGEGE